jgi:type VI secretion system (T6SS) effector TldE1-like protein
MDFLGVSMKKTYAPDLEAFAWTYAQNTGELQQDGRHAATGYSGAGEGRNNPAMESVPNVGPIPRGEWRIIGPPRNSADHGPYVLKLEPTADTETFGRSGFLMHGDSKQHPGSASQGCIILPRAVRESVWNSGDRDVKVVAEIPDSHSEESTDE